MELRLLKPRDQFTTEGDRYRFARLLSCMIEGQGDDDGFEPHKPNKGDTHYWTLDRGNDWKVTFPKDRPDTFEVLYRYNSPACDKETALAVWLCVRVGAEVVGPPRVCAPFPARIPTF